jgi:hypothetical protein
MHPKESDVDENEARAASDRFADDGRYLREHWDELLAKYPDRCIAIYNRKVVAADKDPQKVVEQVKALGLSPGHVYRKWLSTSDDLLILPIHSQ